MTPQSSCMKQQCCLGALPIIQYSDTALCCQRDLKRSVRVLAHSKCQPNWVPALQHEQCNDQALCSKFPEGLKSCPDLPFFANPPTSKGLHGLAVKTEYFLLGGALLVWPGASAKVTRCCYCYSNILKFFYRIIERYSLPLVLISFITSLLSAKFQYKVMLGTTFTEKICAFLTQPLYLDRWQ